MSVFHNDLACVCADKREDCLLKENDVFSLSPKVVITNEEFLSLLVVDSTSHDQELALLALISRRVNPMSKHLSFEEPFREYLEDRFARWQADVELALGSVRAETGPLPSSQNDDSDFASPDLVQTDGSEALGVLSAAHLLLLNRFEGVILLVRGMVVLGV